MKKISKINFIIDVLMFILVMAMGGIGFLMKFILVPGSTRMEIYGSNVDLFLWGWDRHQWGSVHLILGYILLGLLVLHIFFHWGQIKNMFRNLINNKPFRIIITLLFLSVSVVLFVFGFVVNIEVVVSPKRGEGGRRIERARLQTEELPSLRTGEPGSETSGDRVLHEREDVHHERTMEVYGSMTFKEVENQYTVPADSLKKYLGIPLRINDNERIGRLRRKYNFHMSDVERLIEKYHKR
ncbi:DUF4405 domain-containing protein [bacterium]|nr:DUF4405 domain-containing protein [bacterium]